MFLWTGASGALGQGGVFSTVKPCGASHIAWDQAYSKPLSSHHHSKDIAVLVALRLWGEPYFTHSQLVVHTDNSAVFHSPQHWTTRSPAIGPLRNIALLSAQHPNPADLDTIPGELACRLVFAPRI